MLALTRAGRSQSAMSAILSPLASGPGGGPFAARCDITRRHGRASRVAGVASADARQDPHRQAVPGDLLAELDELLDRRTVRDPLHSRFAPPRRRFVARRTMSRSTSPTAPLGFAGSLPARGTAGVV